MNDNNAHSLRSRFLARHADAQPRLDEIRRAVLSETLARRDADEAPVPISQLLGALFLPNRRLWTALAAIWVLLATFHFTQRPANSPAATASHETIARTDVFLNRQAQLHALLR